MTFYTAIWRLDSDDFLFTEFPLDDIEEYSNQEIVELCWDIENDEGENPFTTEDPPTYELIEILGGNITFHMK